MVIIFAKIPKYLDLFCIVIRKLGPRLFYLELTGDRTKEKEYFRVQKLKAAGIFPLPIEDLPHFTGFSELNSDPEKKTLQRTREIAPDNLLKIFGPLFPNITDIEEKLLIAVHSAVALQIFQVSAKVNLWARENKDKKILLITISPEGFLLPEMAPNVRQLVVPVEIFANGLDAIFHLVLYAVQWLQKTGKSGGIPERILYPLKNIPHPRVALVTHKGLNYGNLYQKNLFYSDQEDSDLHPQQLLHLDYNGWPSPSEKLTWYSIGNHRQSWIPNIRYAIQALSKGILQVRHLRHIISLFIIVRFYIIYQSFSSKLESFPDLKVAIIDFDILCPKELLLAFESRNIRTVATQERFVLAFNTQFGSTILSHYLCSSPYTINVMRSSPLYAVDHFYPVGQYRSDNLLVARMSPPPEVITAARIRGLQIITALGFNPVMDWQRSQVDPLSNWSAHRHFLEDMVRLSKDIPGIFIILRYKDMDWITLPAFADIVRDINFSDNLTFSLDYDRYLFSYDLCAHSDLVIAKHTSLADECLSVGIPVLFHEYTHNTERLIADAYDYSPTEIMCFRYEELLERTKIILGGSPIAMTGEYEFLKQEIYGGLGDGRVRERIHAHIEEMLSGE